MSHTTVRGMVMQCGVKSDSELWKGGVVRNVISQ